MRRRASRSSWRWARRAGGSTRPGWRRRSPIVKWPPAAPATAIHVHPDTGEVSAPLGAVDALARGARDLARAFGGRSVATVEYATHDPLRPLTFAAREGEPTVVAVGEQHFQLP